MQDFGFVERIGQMSNLYMDDLKLLLHSIDL